MVFFFVVCLLGSFGICFHGTNFCCDNLMWFFFRDLSLEELYEKIKHDELQLLLGSSPLSNFTRRELFLEVGSFERVFELQFFAYQEKR